ncbi:putative phosphorylase [Aspergillus clavatus NRRL 1]|uniref:Phosphorylase, putative n=1 Tax=Aspergillus clavatus (strain ATCC 1007 / CBS 513.65 / DSM 816 / NCTC 3887 / NRRL 1 / QM 1276 / 107) TaxID=344612 RepID=A1CC28_ASPCL|nr:phosphorylase, putative [Aspergillus clavatus NRRL 1]EAW13296.1 phosphorylase, putative [Aspergillus clavatus NRRL 1]
MSSVLNYEALLATFDDLVARQIIFYTPPKTVRLDDEAFPLEFHISTSLLTKPASGESITASDSAHPPGCFGPGSDIGFSDPSILIDTIRNTHLLVVNKFAVFRPQLLLLTSDSYQRQHEPLSLADFAAVCTVLDSLKSPHYAIYNCSPLAGSSREHKHLQILPRPGYLFPDDPNPASRVIPYQYFIRYLDAVDFQSLDGWATIFKAYQELLAQAKQAWSGHSSNEQNPEYYPHNVALVREWIVVIPRRSNNFEGITANAAGMMGSVWLTNDSQLDRWREVGPPRVLSELGVPKP